MCFTQTLRCGSARMEPCWYLKKVPGTMFYPQLYLMEKQQELELSGDVPHHAVETQHYSMSTQSHFFHPLCVNRGDGFNCDEIVCVWTVN